MRQPLKCINNGALLLNAFVCQELIANLARAREKLSESCRVELEASLGGLLVDGVLPALAKAKEVCQRPKPQSASISTCCVV